jgi:predicted metal-dependent hydrolase
MIGMRAVEQSMMMLSCSFVGLQRILLVHPAGRRQAGPKAGRRDQHQKVTLKHGKMLLRVRPGATDERKQSIVAQWYLEQVKVAVPDLIAKWEPKTGVTVDRFFVQQMKTKWGSCNPYKRSIRLNTELAKKAPQCLEYIVVHEMAHLLVRRHNDQFSSLMDRCLLNWKLLRQTLNATPLAHANWDYLKFEMQGGHRELSREKLYQTCYAFCTNQARQ